MPETVDECLIYAEAGKLKRPVRITVKKTPGSEWPTITKYEFAPDEPEREPTISEENAMRLAEQRIAEIRFEALNSGTWIDLDAEPDDIEERLAILAAEDEEDSDIPF